ncbi:GNAT family N-acetyltransferase [Geodermatophilus sp. YIM 151500]|uniref:GNAT family N-acetyltransferase n=1 Tax=Geodermatophilus sp. YIM 151500 TaxID=2984531 RepID=UPI0021E4C121|nr:GNAT family N-acetyltransferase [Geodermatophilus sp. YIM 151500]MCV2489543.1 GNAT family N-acetyltransferase [Geodermatophilus sp. YIM 151500]
MDADAGQVTVEEVPVEVTLPLRGALLRPGRAPGMERDDDPATVHLAARDGRGTVVGVVRVHPQTCPWRPDARAPWQLRGMATDPSVRGAGAGRALVDAVVARVRAAGGDLVWCEARTPAAGFYQRTGFTVVTEPYDKPVIGPHVGMVRELTGGSPSR